MITKLTTELLITAYSQGYFPMPAEEDGEIHWYRPDPRAIIPLNGFHVSRTLRKRLASAEFTHSFDRAFTAVMKACGDREPTWINEEFIAAYSLLHAQGLAHSVEIWADDILVGGAYGVSLGGAFFAESMFHKSTDASKAALYYLIHHLSHQGYSLFECQFLTQHLSSLGAIAISDSEYIKRLNLALKTPVDFS
jgi:leucyl/phenylalanyl-tRNA--protein transferase